MTETGNESASNYRPICELATGGMGVVELAVRQEGRFRRLYAVKRLKEVYRDDTDVREMFVDEARIAGLIRHPNVVSVLDVGEDKDGPFLVMDYVEGVSASMLVAQVAKTGNEIPLQVCLRVAMEAAEGLHAAHELKDGRGAPVHLVHRDVSPQNILIGYDGVARVTDFGVAKALGRITKTQTGVLKGKFGYMPPELLQFDEPDRRADLFSLGVVIFELVTGERLYKNINGMDGARRILKEPPPDVGEFRDDLPPELVQLLFSMLAKKPDQRPADARVVARSLERLISELVATEGRIETSDYVAKEFADRRAAQHQNVQAALSTVFGKLTEPLDIVVELASEPPARRSGLWAAVAAVVLLLGGAAYAATVLLQTDTVATPAELTPPVQASPEPAEPTAGDESEVTDEPTAVVDGPAEIVPADGDEEARARERARLRRLRAASMMSQPPTKNTAGSTGGSGVPMWGWM